MIDVLFGGFLAGLCVGWLLATRTPVPSGVEGAPSACSPRPSTPDTLVVYSDDHWQPEDLQALRMLLAASLPLDLAQAQYDAVLDAIVRDEAGEGIDDVEDAANGRWTP